MTLMLIPSVTAALTASSESTVAGILIITLGRCTIQARSRASARLAALSWAQTGIDLDGDIAVVASGPVEHRRRTSQAERTSRVVRSRAASGPAIRRRLSSWS